jgi:hypothetical protein
MLGIIGRLSALSTASMPKAAGHHSIKTSCPQSHCMKLPKLLITRELILVAGPRPFSFRRSRLDEEQLPQVAGSLTFTTVLALVPILTIALAIFTTFPVVQYVPRLAGSLFHAEPDAEGNCQHHPRLSERSFHPRRRGCLHSARLLDRDSSGDDVNDRSRVQPDLACENEPADHASAFWCTGRSSRLGRC